jgi:putative flavoprotein involved in K+ transport
VQIADELNRAGREVTLSVGRHTRMPRRYRGLDIFWWLETTGRMGRTIEEMPDAVAARRETSLQLVGRADHDRAPQDLDLGVLQSRGVRLVGRLAGMSGEVAELDDDLRFTVGAADRALSRFLDSVDQYVDRANLTREVWPGTRPRPVEVPVTSRRLDLRTEGIGTVLVAAGYQPHHPWLRLPITGPDGAIRQHRGVTEAPGVYTVGQRFQHRRDSAMIDGARHDARMVVEHLLGCRAHGVHATEDLLA